MFSLPLLKLWHLTKLQYIMVQQIVEKFTIYLAKLPCNFVMVNFSPLIDVKSILAIKWIKLVTKFAVAA